MGLTIAIRLNVEIDSEDGEEVEGAGDEESGRVGARVRTMTPGEKQGRLTILCEVARDKRQRQRIKVRCDCGVEKTLIFKSFVTNKVQSCGCLRVERTRTAATIHGHHSGDEPTPEYQAWQSMLQRCYQETCDSYLWYGAKGIGVCREWREDFRSFLADVGLRPSDEHVLCLLDKSKDFAPGNAKWLTEHETHRKRRNNTFYTVNNVTKCLVDWAAEYGIPKATLHYRVVTKGMTMRDALDVGRGTSGKVLPT